MGSAASTSKQKKVASQLASTGGKETNNTQNKQIVVVPGEGHILHRDNHGIIDDEDATDTGTSYIFLPQQLSPDITSKDDPTKSNSNNMNDNSKEVHQVKP